MNLQSWFGFKPSLIWLFFLFFLPLFLSSSVFFSLYSCFRPFPTFFHEIRQVFLLMILCGGKNIFFERIHTLIFFFLSLLLSPFSLLLRRNVIETWIQTRKKDRNRIATFSPDSCLITSFHSLSLSSSSFSLFDSHLPLGDNPETERERGREKLFDTFSSLFFNSITLKVRETVHL